MRAAAARAAAAARSSFAVFPHPKRLRTALRFSRLPAPGPFRPLHELAPTWQRAGRAAARDAGRRRADRAGRPPHRLRAERPLRRGQPRLGARALGRGLRGDGAVLGGCCGALALHAGRREQGLALARRTAAAFRAAGAETIVTNAAGCGSHLKEAGLDLPVRRHLRGARRGQRPRSGTRCRCASPSRSRATSATRSACGGAARMLRSIPGSSSSSRPSRSSAAGARGSTTSSSPTRRARSATARPRTVLATEPDVYVSANPGCLLQVRAALRRAGRPMPAVASGRAARRVAPRHARAPPDRA